MGSVVQTMLGGLLLALFPASLIAWITLLKRRITSGRLSALLPYRPRPLPHWSPLTFLVLMGLFLVAGPLVRLAFASVGLVDWPESGASSSSAAPQRSAELMIGATVFLVSCLLTGAYIYVMAPKRFGVVGLRPTWSGVRLGLIASVLVLPPLMILMAAVSWLVPYEHEVLDVMEKQLSLSSFLKLFFVTAILTPIVEEFSVRVVLQGSLQGLADAGKVRPWHDDGQAESNNAAAESSPATPTVTDTPSSDAGIASAESVSNAPQPTDPTPTNPVQWVYQPIPGRPEPPPPPADAGGFRPADWPIVVTSLFFALLHFGQGLAPVPLFFLSLALGYLYRQTGNITASIVVHMVLNSLTMIVTFVTLMTEA
ncbi:CPBP family intramembrane glutamic endopeptidase [Crateriforma conspicua]|uniref:CAAX amino terminal protease self-immunity n=1 Tax=Crateriforma conspicua TaxID=2527996 RepID=A0A5C6FUP3_9PLAN|nr:CPBP family intramembrane glutamic endopeptidase [Crateriforma conspicua]TWU66782.1 CAAX amino terminal protease self- immunity [Crateriforma conspicua]